MFPVEAFVASDKLNYNSGSVHLNISPLKPPPNIFS